MAFIKALGTALALSMLFGTAALADQAPTQKSQNSCFFAQDARGFEVIGNDVLQVRTAFDYYDLRMNFCPQLRWADRIGFDNFSSWVCQNDMVYLYDFRGQLIDRCWIDSITPSRR